MSVSLNQYHGEIGSFYNLLTSQITKLPISLFNILVQIFLLQIKKKKTLLSLFMDEVQLPQG